MNDHECERLSRYFDDELSAAEAAQIESRIENDAEWRQAYAELDAVRDAVRGYVRTGVERADFGSLWAGIDTEMAESPEPMQAGVRPPQGGPWSKFLHVWGANWATVVTSAVAAAVVAFVVVQMTGSGPNSHSEGTTTVAKSSETRSADPARTPGLVPATDTLRDRNVVIDSVINDGNTTVLISMPAEDEGATVIWLLEDEDEEGDGAGAEPVVDQEPI